MIERKLSAVFTQGTLMGDFVIGDMANYIMAICEDEKTRSYGICFADTGVLCVFACHDEPLTVCCLPIFCESAACPVFAHALFESIFFFFNLVLPYMTVFGTGCLSLLPRLGLCVRCVMVCVAGCIDTCSHRGIQPQLVYR